MAAICTHNIRVGSDRYVPCKKPAVWRLHREGFDDTNYCAHCKWLVAPWAAQFGPNQWTKIPEA